MRTAAIDAAKLMRKHRANPNAMSMYPMIRTTGLSGGSIDDSAGDARGLPTGSSARQPVHKRLGVGDLVKLGTTAGLHQLSQALLLVERPKT